MGWTFRVRAKNILDGNINLMCFVTQLHSHGFRSRGAIFPLQLALLDHPWVRGCLLTNLVLKGSILTINSRKFPNRPFWITVCLSSLCHTQSRGWVAIVLIVVLRMLLVRFLCRFNLKFWISNGCFSKFEKATSLHFMFCTKIMISCS